MINKHIKVWQPQRTARDNPLQTLGHDVHAPPQPPHLPYIELCMYLGADRLQAAVLHRNL